MQLRHLPYLSCLTLVTIVYIFEGRSFAHARESYSESGSGSVSAETDSITGTGDVTTASKSTRESSTGLEDNTAESISDTTNSESSTITTSTSGNVTASADFPADEPEAEDIYDDQDDLKQLAGDISIPVKDDIDANAINKQKDDQPRDANKAALYSPREKDALDMRQKERLRLAEQRRDAIREKQNKLTRPQKPNQAASSKATTGFLIADIVSNFVIIVIGSAIFAKLMYGISVVSEDGNGSENGGPTPRKSNQRLRESGEQNGEEAEETDDDSNEVKQVTTKLSK